MAKRNQSENQLKNLEKGKAHQFKHGESTPREWVEKREATKAKNRTFRDELLVALEQEISTNDGEKITVRQGMTKRAIKEALDGNSKFWEMIRDTIGEKPADKVQVQMVEQATVDDIEDFLNA